ncbi:MAG: hypothetical protein IPL92_18330 [Saprospiraceae bacterium]|nr:hypothetical protein [Candidatus Opimibacter iunctus]
MKKGVYQLSIVLAVIFSVTILPKIHAQGCSDAGLCKIDVLKPDPENPLLKHDNKVNAGLSIGAADYGITVFGGSVGYSRKLGEQWSLDTKLTLLSQRGNDIAVMGPGDIFANVNYKASQKFTLTAGVKIPLMKADRAKDGLPLPMDYQSSLGTLDLLTGIRYNTEKWQWALAVQIPLHQNDNAFFSGLYDTLSPLHEIQTTNAFERKADIMLHVSRTIEMSEKVTITPGLLPIYHVAEDEYTDIDGIQYPIAGSDGLTLNGTIFVDVKTGATGNLEFDLGFPFIVRDARPDGLTRGFVFGVSYSYAF